MRLQLHYTIFILFFIFDACNKKDTPSIAVPQTIIKKDTNFIITNDGEKIPTGIPIQTKGRWNNPDSVVQPKENSSINIQPKHLKHIKTTGKTVVASAPQIVRASTMMATDLATHNIRFLPITEGLSSSYITEIFQDSHEKLWFGTHLGVSCYDGNSFTHFTSKEGLIHNYVETILEDNKGNMWFGTKGGGVSCYNGKNFTNFTTKEGLIHNYVLSIEQDNEGNIWIGTEGGLSRYNGKSFTHFTIKDGLSHNTVQTMLKDRQGDMWFGTSHGVTFYDGKNFTHFTTKEGLNNNEINSILEDRQGDMWFGTSHGVTFYDGKNFTRFTTKEGLNNNEVNSILEDRQWNIWFGTIDGLIRYDGNSFTKFTTREGITYKSIRTLLEDNYGNIWMGTWGGGVNRFKEKSFTHFTTEDGLNNNFVLFTFEDELQNMWFGTYGGGVNVYDGKNFTYLTTKEGLVHNGVHSILKDKDGDMWFGTYGGGVSHYDGKSFTNFTTKEGLSSNYVTSMLEDKQGNLWFGTRRGGISCYDRKKFTHFTTKEGLSNTDVWSMIEDRQGNLWIGTDGGGVCRYDRKSFTHFTTKEGLSNDFIRGLLEDSQGNIWIGTDAGGLNRYDGKDFIHFTTKEGLSHNSICSIIEDNKNRIWVATQMGISVLIPKNNSPQTNKNSQDEYYIHTFGKEDGLKNLDFEINSVYKTNEDIIGWGSRYGITYINLKEFNIPSSQPEVELNTIKIAEKFIDYKRLSNKAYRMSIPFGEDLNNTFDSIGSFQNYPNRLSLPHNLNHLTFIFTAIDWSAPHKLKYSYYLKGLDKDWTEPNKKSEADYRNIPHGTYTFKVKTIGAAQKWSEPFEYTFTINPPWWLTWWAKTIYGFTFLGLLYLVRQIEMNKQQRKLAQQQRINKATAKFVPTTFLQSLGRKDIMEVQLGDAVEQEVTVMFSDIRDYTTLSENMTPEATFQFVNDFNKRMGPVITKNNGFVNQYLGDAIMALFKTSPKDALQAAVQMQQVLSAYNEQRVSKKLTSIRMGIGLHTGSLIMGIIGDDERMDAATISDTVNTTSRIESLSKYFKANILLSGESLHQIKQHKQAASDNNNISDFNVRFLGKVQLKGKKEPVDIYECFDGDAPDVITKKLECQALFKKGMDCYLSKKFMEAKIAFEEVLAINKEDQTASLFHQKSAQYIIEGVPDDWTGVEIMTFK